MLIKTNARAFEFSMTTFYFNVNVFKLSMTKEICTSFRI